MNWEDIPQDERVGTYVELPKQVKDALDRSDETNYAAISQAVATHLGIGEREHIEHQIEQARERREELLEEAAEEKERIEELEERLDRLDDQQDTYEDLLEEKAEFFLSEQPNATILPSSVSEIATEHAKTTDDVLDDLVNHTEITEERIERDPSEPVAATGGVSP